MVGENNELLDILYKEKKYKEYIASYNEYRKNNPNINRSLYNKYLWSSYYAYYAIPDNFNSDNLSNSIKYIDYIVKNVSKQEMIYHIVVFKYIEFLLEKQNPDYLTANKFLDYLDYGDLDTEEKIFVDKDGKERVFASKREKWFVHKSKCLEELERYNDLIEHVNLAFEVLENFNNNNDVWLRKRLSLAYQKTKKYKEAINSIDLALERKKEWFLVSQKASILVDTLETEEANDLYLKSIIMNGPDEMKIKVFSYFQKITQVNNGELSNRLKEYINFLRYENDWPIESNYKEVIINNPQIYNKDFMRKSKDLIIKNLTSLYKIKRTKYLGKVQRFDEVKKFGFISDEKKKEIYFTLKNKENRNFRNFKLGDSVSFEVIESFDKIKNRKSHEAINLELVLNE